MENLNSDEYLSENLEAGKLERHPYKQKSVNYMLKIYFTCHRQWAETFRKLHLRKGVIDSINFVETASKINLTNSVMVSLDISFFLT